MIGRGATPGGIEALNLPRPSQRGEPAWEVASCFPRQGEWTEDDFLEFETVNFPVELVDGCLEFLPMPPRYHQRLLRILLGLLEPVVKRTTLGEVLFAPCPIRLAPGLLREPDLFVVKPSDKHPPDATDVSWVLEIVSPGTKSRERDLVDKRGDYARAKIREYWIVDPEEQKVSVLCLKREELPRSWRVPAGNDGGVRAASGIRRRCGRFVRVGATPVGVSRPQTAAG
jgi:Uma2 family endonuclease